MKKNKMMRLASGLLVAVLITTSTISGTFAKYTTAAEAKDQARVAKFGVTVIGEVDELGVIGNNDMFINEYNNGVDVTVQSTVDVVAPGTSGTLSSFDISGEPEVAVEVNYDDAALTLEGWKVGVDDYCPIVFTIKVDGLADVVVNENGDMEMAAIETAVETAVKAAKKTYAPGANLADAENDLVVEWEWPFRTGADDTAKDANDIKDTALGDAAATGTEATIKFAATCTVNQID